MGTWKKPERNRQEYLFRSRGSIQRARGRNSDHSYSCLMLGRRWKREPDTLPKISPLRSQMIRSGYIEAIEHGRAVIKGNTREKAKLDPWDYALLCSGSQTVSLLAHSSFRLSGEPKGASPAYQQIASELVGSVLRSPRLFQTHSELDNSSIADILLQRLSDKKNDPCWPLRRVVRELATPITCWQMPP